MHIMSYSIEPRDQIFATGYGSLSFTKNIDKIIGKYTYKKLNSKYSYKFLDHTQKPTTNAIKAASKKKIKKPARSTCDLIGNKIVDKIKSSASDTVSHADAKSIQIRKEKQIPPEKTAIYC